MTRTQQYFRNLALWAKGIRWLWTRAIPYEVWKDWSEESIYAVRDSHIRYKENWTPAMFFWRVYLHDMLLACLLGRGVQSLSRAFQLFGERHHWGRTGPLLWGSVDLWE